LGAHVARAAAYAVKYNQVSITPLDSSLAKNNELGLLGWVQIGKDAYVLIIRPHINAIENFCSDLERNVVKMSHFVIFLTHRNWFNYA
jgi:hypothetical protein